MWRIEGYFQGCGESYGEVKIVPLEPRHLLEIRVQDAQRNCDVALRNETNAQELARAGPAFTALESEIPIACAGLAHCGSGRYLAWSVISPRGLERFGGIHRGVRRFLEIADYRRIEAVVDVEHEKAIRWIEVLGFEREGVMRKYTENGRDVYLYARLK